MTPANRVIINTGILYVRMVLTIGISFYATRIILNVLGVSDFGIFQLVGGVIAMLAFLKTTMATSTQRFLSFYQGCNDEESQKFVFVNSLFLHFVVGLGLVLILFILEQFLFEKFLNIPENRIFAAKIVYRAMLVSLFFSMINVSFIGSLIAHENLLFVAIVNIIEALLKLTIALFLIVVDSDKLIMYAILMALLSLVTLILYMIYCFKNYKECSLNNFKIHKNHINELTSFAGWNLFGSLCGLSRNQGLAVLLNLYFGTIINAAYGLANQVASQVDLLSVTMLRALNPQIMKSEGADNRERMLRLAMIASKFGFFLVAFIAIPAIFEMHEILKIWLKQVPEHTVMFTNLILISTLTNQLTIGLQSALQATGKIKLYQSVVGGVILLTLPLAYVFLRLGYPPYDVFISYLLIEIIACFLRIYLSKVIAELSIRTYIKRVFLPEILPVILSILSCCFIIRFFNFDYRFLLTGIVSAVVFLVSIYLFGLCEDEKILAHKFFLSAFKKFKK